MILQRFLIELLSVPLQVVVILTRVLLTIITKDNNLTFEIEDEETSKHRKMF
jgi:hypothetical protein